MPMTVERLMPSILGLSRLGMGERDENRCLSCLSCLSCFSFSRFSRSSFPVSSCLSSAAAAAEDAPPNQDFHVESVAGTGEGDGDGDGEGDGSSPRIVMWPSLAVTWSFTGLALRLLEADGPTDGPFVSVAPFVPFVPFSPLFPFSASSMPTSASARR